MKTTLSLIVLLVISFSSYCAQWEKTTIKGSGNVETQERKVSHFDEISVSQGIKVILTQGAEISVKVETDNNIQEYIKTEVSDNTLKIFIPNNTQVKAEKMIVYVTAPELKDIDATTASKVESTTPWKMENVEISVTTAANVELDITANEVEVTGTTAASVSLSGSCRELDASFTTAASFNGKGLNTEKAEVKATTGSSLDVNVSKVIGYDISTGASLVYRGAALLENTSRTSSGGSATHRK